MSWDVMIFSSSQKIVSLEDIDEALFVPIDFSAILKNHFPDVISDGEHREIKGDGYSIGYFADSEPSSNMLFNLYGEKALFELMRIAKILAWQIFDTGNGQMLDLENPSKNGYHNFQAYLTHVLKQ